MAATSDADAAEPPAWDAVGFGVASWHGDLARVRELTSPDHMAAHSGVDLNTTAYARATSLYGACSEGHTEVVRYLASPAMLAAGIDVNKGNSRRTSPLAIAAAYSCVEAVRHLLESPDVAAAGVAVDVNAADVDGRTALHWACIGTASAEVVSLLLRLPQLDLGARDKDGQTVLQMAEMANLYVQGRGAEKATLIREAMQVRMAGRFVLVVAMWSRRERRAGEGAGAGAGAGAAPALPAGTLHEEDEEARARRRLMGSLPPVVLTTVYALAGGV